MDMKQVSEKRLQHDEQVKKQEQQLREYEELQQGEQPEEPVFDPIDVAPKNFQLKHLALVVDTLGQERMLTHNERN